MLLIGTKNADGTQQATAAHRPGTAFRAKPSGAGAKSLRKHFVIEVFPSLTKTLGSLWKIN